MKSYNATGDITGQVFGNLLALNENGRSKWGDVMWDFECECGNIIRLVAARVKRGELSHCGCKYVLHNKKHGRCRTKEYNTWSGMIARCYNNKSKNYHRYGGRGIRMSDEWRDSFETFFKDMGVAPSAKHSIERIDNNIGYCKKNCKWATSYEQCRNRRSNNILEINGERLCVYDWCKRFGLSWHTYKSRKRAGVSIDKIFLPPKHKKHE